MRAAKVLIVAGLLTGCVSAPVVRAPDRPVQFLLVNDVYVGDTALDGHGGLARLATLRSELERNGPVILFLAGDFISPSLLSKWYRGQHMIQFFNSARLDYATPGNHEFSFDRATLEQRIRESRFRWISSNCLKQTASTPPNYTRWDTLTVSGTRFGVFGLTLLGPYAAYVPCGDPDSAAHAVVQELKAAGAQVIFGLTHLDRAQDSAILANEPDIAFILGGHEHTPQEITLGSRVILKAEQNARSAQLLVLSRANGILTQSHRLIILDKQIPPDPATERLVAGWQDTLRRRLGPERIVGITRDTLDARNTRVRKGETNFGSLVADAVRVGTGSDIGLIPGGTMRLDNYFEPGPVTNWKIESVFLFASETRIMTFELTGNRLRELIEHSLSHGLPAGMTVGWGGWLQVSGIRYRWRPESPVGSRVVGDILREPGGRAIKPDEILRVAMTDYQVCEAGDGYVVPEAAAACTTRAKGPRTADLIIKYIEGQAGRVVPRPSSGRVTLIR